MIIPGDYQVRINDVDLSYSVVGDGPILFVTSPGWGIGARYLQEGLKPLLQNFRIVFVTARGSGKSGRPADMSQMGSTHMADDIDGLRRHLGLETIDFFGHSNGGAIAVAYAQRHGAHLAKLILTSSQLIGFDVSASINSFLARAANDPRYSEAARHVGQAFPKDNDEFRAHFIRRLPLYFHDPINHAPTFIRDMGTSFSAWAYHAQVAADRLPDANQVGRLAAITAETLIIVGRQCWICPPSVSERLHSAIDGSKLVVLESTGHFPWIEEPGLFFPEISRFLARPNGPDCRGASGAGPVSLPTLRTD
jgi:proline iminopeptidase